MNLSRGMLLLVGTAFAFVTGCGGSSIQHRRVEKVKSAAIVAVAAGLHIANRDQGKHAGTIGAMQEMGTMGSDERIAERKAQGSAIYDTLVAEMGKSMGWTFKTRDEVAADPANKSFFTEKIGEPSSFQLGGTRIYVPGILWTERVGGLTEPERKKLHESLGVDALIFVNITYVVGRKGPVTWKVGRDGVVTVSGPIPGTSAVFPSARVYLEVFDGDTMPQGIWASGALGQPASMGVVTTMGVEYKTDMVPILTEAVETAWKALLEDYQADKVEAAKAEAEAAKAQ